MRTQIRYKTGEVETYENSAPSIDFQDKLLNVVRSADDGVENVIHLDEIEKVVFIP
jgi:hypothetical protein